jgi:transcriptional regulator with XRE-family HTH domain
MSGVSRLCRCGSPLAHDDADSLCTACQDTPRRGRPPNALDPDASHAARLGAEIRTLRQARGLTLEALGALIGFSAQHISEVERAKASVSEPFVAACDRALDARGALVALLPPVLWERALQRHDRAAARHRSAGDVPVDAESQALTRADGAARYAESQPPSKAEEDVEPLSRRSLIGTGVGAALGLGPTTPPAAARDLDPGLVLHWVQLLSVLDRHDAMFGPHEVLTAVRNEVALIAQHRRLARGELRTQLLRVESRWSGFASWLAHDAGEARLGDQWATRALRLAHAAGYQDMIAWILMRQSEWAATRPDPRRAIAFAEAARRTPETRDQIRAVCTLRAAQGHALANDQASCERSLAQARTVLLDRRDTAGDTARQELGGYTVTRPYVLADEARCWIQLRPHTAMTMYQDALRLWPRDRTRSRGVQQARLALACEAANEPERAAAEGLKALEIAQATKSDLTARELKRLNRRLAACDLPAAADFREAFAAS